MNDHLNFLYNWFSEIDCQPQFPNIQFSQPTLLTVKQELKQLSQDIGQTDSFYSKEFMRLKDRLFNPFGVNPAVHRMIFGYITSLYENKNNPSMIYGIIFTPKSKRFPKDNISPDSMPTLPKMPLKKLMHEQNVFMQMLAQTLPFQMELRQ